MVVAGALVAPSSGGKLWKLTEQQPRGHLNPRQYLWTWQLWLQPAGSEEILLTLQPGVWLWFLGAGSRGGIGTIRH